MHKFYPSLFLFVLLNFCLNTSAQVNKRLRDSLTLLLAQHPAEDTARIKLLNRFARVSRHDNADTAMLLTEQAFRIADKVKATEWIGRLYATKSMIFSKKDQYDSCIKYGLIAADMLKKEKQFSEYLTILNIIAENHSSKGDFSKAIDIFHEVSQVAEQEGNKDNHGAALGNIGSIYYNFDLYNQAIESYKKALAMFEEIKDSILIAAAESNIGLAYNGLKQSAKAQEHLQRSLEIFERLRRTDVLPDIKAALALTYARQGNTAHAITLLNDALPAAEKANNAFSLANVHIVLATAKKIAGDSLHRPEMYKEALQHAEKGMTFSTKIKEAVMTSRAFDEMSQLYFRLGQFQNAYIFKERYTNLKDSIAGENRKQEIAIKESEFKNANVQLRLIAEHQAAILKQKHIRNLIIIASASVLLIGMLIFIFYRRYNKSRSLQLKSELKAEMAELEMKALRTQMNPHFIFNSLNSIADYISKNEIKDARDYLTKFARLMRMILEHSEMRLVPLSKDIEALDIYMNLESLRFENKPDCSIAVDKDVDTENTLVPSLMLQPFVENCFKHGLQKTGRKGKIMIHVSKSGDTLHCTIEDNGTGINTAKKGNAQPSYGLSITQSRIQAIHDRNSNETPVKITNLAQGTRIDVFIPIR